MNEELEENVQNVEEIEEEVVEDIVLDSSIIRTTKPRPKPTVVEASRVELSRPIPRKYWDDVTCNFECHEKRDSGLPGIDWAVPVGTQITAAHDGTVIVADSVDNSSMGKYIVVRHRSNGVVWEEYYLHLSKVMVKVGRKVSKGEQIAKSGNTGKSTGPHLHFSVRKGGKLVNPARHF